MHKHIVKHPNNKCFPTFNRWAILSWPKSWRMIWWVSMVSISNPSTTRLFPRVRSCYVWLRHPTIPTTWWTTLSTQSCLSGWRMAANSRKRVVLSVSSANSPWSLSGSLPVSGQSVMVSIVMTTSWRPLCLKCHNRDNHTSTIYHIHNLCNKVKRKTTHFRQGAISELKRFCCWLLVCFEYPFSILWL